MKKQTAADVMKEKWNLSFTPVLRYNIILCTLIVVMIALGGMVIAIFQMKEYVQRDMRDAQAQVEYRIDQAVKLLESMADQKEFYDPDLPPYNKAVRLDKISSHLGYMMICYVDADINVHSSDAEPASLASRDYMQRLFATGKKQVTDSFAAGADGVTLNYTVAVPMFDKSGDITGCLFSAIYFDEIVELLSQTVSGPGMNAVLIGSQGQIMSSTNDLEYGDQIMHEIKQGILFGTSASKVETALLNKNPGSYWSIRGGNLKYTSYTRIENTQWDLLCTSSFWEIYRSLFPLLLLVMAVCVAICMIMHRMMNSHIKSQMSVVNMLVQSIEELEKKIYQDERPDNPDFNEIIRLTSNGLSDGLTGVVTRSVFFNQMEGQLKKLRENKKAVLCFVDLDDLKKLNDRYGHSAGDIALKSVGYILREYEKKYDGLVGRYGGDEFILLMTELDDEKELENVLDELVLRLNTTIAGAEEEITIHCSVGVSFIRTGEEINQVIAEADEALYFVKQNRKGYYKIYRD